VPVPDPRALAAALEHVLGRDKVVAKERTLWRHGATRIHLDRVDGLGDFLELETLIRDGGSAAAARECRALLDSLGVLPEDLVPVPYRDLLP
jgi:adenylate cyclase class IV